MHLQSPMRRQQNAVTPNRRWDTITTRWLPLRIPATFTFHHRICIGANVAFDIDHSQSTAILTSIQLSWTKGGLRASALWSDCVVVCYV